MLTPDDRKKLIRLLTRSRSLSSSDRINSMLFEAGLDILLPQLDLSGPPVVVVSNLIQFLENYGRVSFGHHVLGLYLSVVKEFVGIEDKKYLDGLISRYQLMVPVVQSLVKDNWDMLVTSQDYLEKIIGENTLRPIAFLQMALDAARSVVYIEVRHPNRNWWSGTGFLISKSLLLTNNHVIPEPDLIPVSIFRFNYQEDAQHNPVLGKDYKARNGGIFYTSTALDYTIIELENNPGDQWGVLRVTKCLPEIEQRVNIIQHPGGRPKQIAMQNNFVKYVSAKKLHYITSTLPGSSGSPVFNDRWEVVGLHHAGGDLPEVENGPTYYRNEGITIGAILNDLPTKLSGQFTQATCEI